MHKWLKIEEGQTITVLPDRDIKPHSSDTHGDNRSIAYLDCPCKPDIKFDGRCMWILHNSFEDIQKIEDSFARHFMV